MIHLVSPLMNTRVLKAHVEAVANSFEEALAIKRISGKNAAAEFIALNCLSATDSKPSYVVVVFEGNRQHVFGPYKSAKAAAKARKGGFTGAKQNSVRGYVAPLIPAPKLKYLGKGFEQFTDNEWSENE